MAIIRLTLKSTDTGLAQTFSNSQFFSLWTSLTELQLKSALSLAELGRPQTDQPTRPKEFRGSGPPASAAGGADWPAPSL